MLEKIFEYSNPVFYDPDTGEIKPLDEANPSDVDFWLYSSFSVDPDFVEILSVEDTDLVIKHETTAGEILISSLLLIIIFFLFINLVLQRILPRFIRFWK